MKRIIVTGSLAFDYIMDFPDSYENHIVPDKIKTLSVSFLLQTLNKNYGGVAVNIAYNLALLKHSSSILASAGQKDFSPYQDYLQKNGVDTSLIYQVPDEFSAHAFMMTDQNNCQISGFYPGALQKDLQLTLPSEDISLVIIGATLPQAMYNFAQQAHIRHIPYIFSPGQQLTTIEDAKLKEIIKNAHIFIANDYEMSLVEKKTGWKPTDLLAHVQILVTTLGAHGSLIQTRDERITTGIAQPETVVDPTGAGDAYIAGFAAGYLNKLSLKTCGQLGATLSSFAIEKYGTQNHHPLLETIKKRYQKNFGDQLFLE